MTKCMIFTKGRCIMKIVFKGNLEEKNMPTTEIPKNAQELGGESDLKKIKVHALMYLFPIWILQGILIYTKTVIYPENEVSTKFQLISFVIILLTIIPHEFLHAICFPKNATVYLFTIKTGMAVMCTEPITKRRFCVLLLLPCLVLGVIPLVVWLFLADSFLANVLYNVGCGGIFVSIIDFYSLSIIRKEMPKGSYIISSGNNSYWYMPQSTAYSHF